jgi:hypothetical protein
MQTQGPLSLLFIIHLVRLFKTPNSIKFYILLLTVVDAITLKGEFS